MLNRKHRITIFTGNYGSGKTEIALNAALALKRSGAQQVMLADFDIINPYFRSALHRDLLESSGIEFLQPPYALTNVDMPVLSADVLSIFERHELQTFIDVGGDDTGAAAIGQFKRFFEREGCDLLYVINALRPLSSNADDIISMLNEIAGRVHMLPSGLINNTNLQDETTAELLLDGQRVVEDVSKRTGIPVWGIGARPDIIPQLPEALQPLCFEVERKMRIDWL